MDLPGFRLHALSSTVAVELLNVMALSVSQFQFQLSLPVRTAATTS